MTILGLPLTATLLSLYCLNAVLAYAAYPVLAIGRTNLAFMAFAALGSYMMAGLIIHDHWSMLLSALVGVAAAAIVALPLGKLVSRVTGTYLAIATLNVVMVSQIVVFNFTSWTGGAAGLLGIDRLADHPLVLVVAIVVIAAGFALVQYSGLGGGLRAQRSDSLLAESVGVRIGQNVLIMIVVSAVLGAIYGELTVLFYGFDNPSFYSFSSVILALAMVVLGGRGSWCGPLIGAAFFTVLPVWLRVLGIWNEVAVAAILLLVAIYAPEGVAGLVARKTRLRRSRGSTEGTARLAATAAEAD